MGTTFKYAPKRWSGEISEGPSVDKERAGHGLAAEDIFDDPSILGELREANASLANGRETEPETRVAVRLPSVDAFNFAVACHANDFEEAHGINDFDEAHRTNDFDEAHRAKSLAHRLGPPEHDRSAKRRWWSFRTARDPKGHPGGAERRGLPSYAQTLRGSRRALFWGFCTSLAIVIAAPIVFGNFRPVNEPSPAPVDDARNNAETNAGLVANGVQEAPVANEAAADRLLKETVVVRNKPAAASIIAPATTAFAMPLVRATTDEAGRNLGEEPKLSTVEPKAAAGPAATGLAVASPDSPVPAPQPIDKAAPEIVPPPPEPAANSDKEEFAQMAQSQLSGDADPSPTGALAATTGEAVTAAEADASPVSGEEIDRMLSRGEDLLRSGDIASARLLFLHVAAAGDRRGAKAVGMTYDPKVYAHLPVMGLAPDLAQAEFWYEKAGADLSYTIDLTPPDAFAQVAETAEDEARRQWNAACAHKYLSFEPSTGLYTGRSGTKRRCQLP